MGIFVHDWHAPGGRARFAAAALTALTVLVALALGGAQPAAAQGAVKSVHKDWQIRSTPRPAPSTSNAP